MSSMDAAECAGPADALVVFDATSETALREVFPAMYVMARAPEWRLPVICVGEAALEGAQFRARLRGRLASAIDGADAAVLDRVLSALSFVGGDGQDAASFAALRLALRDAKHPLFLLPGAPRDLPIVAGLHAAGLAAGGRIAILKPFAADPAATRTLEAAVREVFAEEAIYRLDHFVDTEAAMNLLYFRFANAFLEPFWNRHHIASVQITLGNPSGAAEYDPGYEGTGCLRDVIPGRLFRLVTLLAMEPPASRHFEAVNRHAADVLAGMRPLAAQDILRAQYLGYPAEVGASEGSGVETFCAVRLHIDDWRWAGVPWYVRAGLRLPCDVCEVLVRLRVPPQNLFGDAVLPEDANTLRFQLAPRARIALGARVKRAGTVFAGEQHEILMRDEPADRTSPRQHLLIEAIAGHRTLFADAQTIALAWEVIAPVLQSDAPLHAYTAGTWGPAAASHFIAADGGWRNPDIP